MALLTLKLISSQFVLILKNILAAKTLKIIIAIAFSPNLLKEGIHHTILPSKFLLCDIHTYISVHFAEGHWEIISNIWSHL